MKLLDHQKGIVSYCEIIDAMITGLKKHSKRKDFEINMNTFGTIGEEVCFGCAATCALQEITGKTITIKSVDDYLNYDDIETCQFFSNGITDGEIDRLENQIDSFRSGNPLGLMKICHVPVKYWEPISEVGTNAWELENHNWKTELHKVEAHLKWVMDKYDIEWHMT